MRKLSETFAVQNIIGVKAPSIDKRENYAWQSLVLFDNVLDTDKVLHSPEIIHLAEYFYGKAFISIVNTEYAEALQEWVRDEMYKADVGNRAMIYPIKAQFDELVVTNPGNDYSGPLNVTIVESEGFERDLLVITCKWGDGVFRNDYYVLGVLADTEDLEMLIETQFQISQTNETYIQDNEPEKEESPESEHLRQVESFAHNKSKRKELIDAFTKIKDHPKATDLKSDVGYAFDESDIEGDLGRDFYAAYEAIGDGGIIYSAFEKTFWIRKDKKLIRIM